MGITSLINRTLTTHLLQRQVPARGPVQILPRRRILDVFHITRPSLSEFLCQDSPRLPSLIFIVLRAHFPRPALCFRLRLRSCRKTILTRSPPIVARSMFMVRSSASWTATATDGAGTPGCTAGAFALHVHLLDDSMARVDFTGLMSYRRRCAEVADIVRTTRRKSTALTGQVT